VSTSPTEATQTSLVSAPAAAPALPPGALLKTLEGLEDSILKDMKLYTWKEGDTYRVIANKYYGDGQKFTVLRRSNEGRNDLQPGEKIFVPVFDSEAAVMTPVPAKGQKVAADPTAKKGDAAKKEAATPSSGKVHVVKDGESLWKIAKQELGNVLDLSNGSSTVSETTRIRAIRKRTERTMTFSTLPMEAARFP
jgi:nucleoid-associated protein YgaU